MLEQKIRTKNCHDPIFPSKTEQMEKDFNGNESNCDLRNQNVLNDTSTSSKMFDEKAASETLLLLSSAMGSQTHIR